MQNQIKIDMDWRPPEGYLEHYRNLIITVLHQWAIFDFTVEREKSKHGWHFVIKIDDEIEDEICLLLQFILGDDRTRCRLNYARWKAKIPDLNKLFKGKIEAVRLD